MHLQFFVTKLQHIIAYTYIALEFTSRNSCLLFLFFAITQLVEFTFSKTKNKIGCPHVVKEWRPESHKTYLNVGGNSKQNNMYCQNQIASVGRAKKLLPLVLLENIHATQ